MRKKDNCLEKEIIQGTTPGAGVGAATDSRQHLDSGVHSSLVVTYSTLEYATPG